ncbi:hypothetical protein LJ739_15225 [Aestuariibacter halophilus]|uniref:Signal protein PDZ n=1 Tax=Fluctibacter halophilus TaxID=226011 RepID=A0ABS8GCT7_9ALTE|nr:hypothetical protein [Aestuariibacter halophilus]MCC2617604.1 hypothetical protein [Aestuariibacter halophilus]
MFSFKKSIALSLVLLVSLCSQSVLAGATRWVPFELVQGRISIPIELDGVSTRAILDTASEFNAISESFIQQHNPDVAEGKIIEIRTVYRDEKRQSYNEVDIEMFGVDFTMDKLVSIDIGVPDTAILLGAGFFDDFIIQIDYPNERLRLLSPGSVDLAKLKNVESQTHRENYMPIVKASLNDDEDVWLVLDTGLSGGVLLERSIADDKGWLSSAVSRPTPDVLELTQVDTFAFNKVTIGPYELDNIEGWVPVAGQDMPITKTGKAQGATRIKGKKIDGLLGNDVLQYFVLTLDYKYGHVHLGLAEETN